MAEATMPDGGRYDGRFNLPLDLHEARSAGAYPDNAAKMSEWYGVTQSQYEAGQNWADMMLRGARQAGFCFASADADWLAGMRAGGRLADGSLHGEDLSEINLSGCDLSRANLSGAILGDATLLRAAMSFADLSKAVLAACDMEGAELSHAILRGATLEEAILTRADLRGADLTEARLDGANFTEADLKGARVSLSQLAQAGGLRLATMPDGRQYDGRLALAIDLDGAESIGIDLDDAEQMSEWYDVDVKDYLAGQKWAEANLEALLPEED
jgi:uncharacterized protein YjbI with pentapeptide repeats